MGWQNNNSLHGHLQTGNEKVSRKGAKYAKDAKMATLAIKNVPEDLCKRLKESAAQHRRSINAEAISCLERVLVSNRVDPNDFLVRVRALCARMPRVFVAQRDLRAARNRGRP